MTENVPESQGSEKQTSQYVTDLGVLCTNLGEKISKKHHVDRKKQYDRLVKDHNYSARDKVLTNSMAISARNKSSLKG